MPLVFDLTTGMIARGAAPATQPATALDGESNREWSKSVAGLQVRFEAGHAMARWLGLQMQLHLRSTSGDSLAVDPSRPGAITSAITRADGTTVQSDAGAQINANEPDWIFLPGDGDERDILLKWPEQNNIDGRVELSNKVWHLRPDSYELRIALHGADASTRYVGSDATVWRGDIELPSHALTVYPDPKPEELAAAAKKIRSNHFNNAQETWQALAQVVTPGMTRRQMEVVLPPGYGPKGQMGFELWFGDYVRFAYGLDADWGVRAEGFGVKIDGLAQPVLWSAPKLVPLKDVYTIAAPGK
jgi:hypothetical protein